MSDETFLRGYESESKLRAKVCKFLSRLEPEVWFCVATGVVKAGVPDIIFCINGQYGGIELKTKKGKLSEKQKVELSKTKKAGGEALVCRSIEEVKKEVNRILNETRKRRK